MESYVVEQETRRLQELESAVFNEFRKDVRKKLRRHSRSGRPSMPKISETDRYSLLKYQVFVSMISLVVMLLSWSDWQLECECGRSNRLPSSEV